MVACLGAPSRRRVLGRLPSWLAVRGHCPLLAYACSFGRWKRSRVQAKSEYTHTYEIQIQQASSTCTCHVPQGYALLLSLSPRTANSAVHVVGQMGRPNAQPINLDVETRNLDFWKPQTARPCFLDTYNARR